MSRVDDFFTVPVLPCLLVSVKVMFDSVQVVLSRLAYIHARLCHHRTVHVACKANRNTKL